jgi:hypothetical protein
MHTDWQNYLIQAGAIIAHGRVVDFDTEHKAAQRKADNIICDLSHYTLLAVQGDDKVKFLQGQFTNDVAKVDDLHSQLNALCNNKGRMLANFRVFSSDGTIFITLPQELAEATLGRLQQYVLRSQVAMGDVSDALLSIGVSGQQAAAALSEHLGTLPADTDEVAQFETAIVIRCAGDNRFELYATPEHMPTHWQALAASASAVAADDWELLNIRAGIPVITAATSEAFVPQMANLELINGVSFTKGCYTGQEIVARMHYLGKLKKRMYRISIDSNKVPAAGEKLSEASATATQDVGTIVSAQLAETGKVEALAVIQNSYVKAGQLKLGSPDGADVTVLELPYSLESAAQATRQKQ